MIEWFMAQTWLIEGLVTMVTALLLATIVTRPSINQVCAINQSIITFLQVQIHENEQNEETLNCKFRLGFV